MQKALFILLVAITGLASGAGVYNPNGIDTIARASAAAAQTTANSASASAVAAASAASAAQTTANSASASAVAAASAASAAQTTANSASASAVAAASAASAAQTTANTANTTANTANSNASTALTTANNASAGGYYGATPHNMVGSRAFGSSYTNSTGGVMHVNVQGTNGSNPNFQVSGVTVCQVTAGTSFCSFVVPAGAVYSSTVSGGTITIWTETY